MSSEYNPILTGQTDSPQTCISPPFVIYYDIVSGQSPETFFLGKMTKLIKYLRELTGFTKTGRSRLGKLIRLSFPHKHAKRGVGTMLIALASGVFFVHQFANIGGVLALNTNTTAVRPTIDVSTNHSIQTPINFESESRGFSWFHSGADLVAPIGTPVHPVMEGTVTATNYDPFGYGLHIIVSHDEDYESLYGHLSKIEVKEGQKVTLATELGLSGSTGFSTGPHLHLEIHQNGSLVNPSDLVPGVN